MLNEKSVLLWGGSQFLNTLAFVNPQAVTQALSWISTALVIYYHIVKIRAERKAKS